MIQNLWDTSKSVLRGKIIVIQTYLRKKEKSQITKPTPNELEKKEKIQPKVSRWNGNLKDQRRNE